MMIKKSKLLWLTLGGLILILVISVSILKHLKSNVSPKLLSTSVTNQYLYQSKSKGFAVYLGNRKETQTPEVKLAVADSFIEFKSDNISDKTKLTKENGESLVYKNVYPGIDFQYTLIEKGVKEEIIINNQQSIINNPQFTFKLNLKNAVPQKDLMDDSIITFVDSVSGDYLFHFEKPFMIDAGGNRSDNVTLKIQHNSPSNSTVPNDINSASFLIVITPDSNWLKTALYPVVIDPTVVLDNADTVANWTSSDDINFTKSQDTSDKQEGTGSIQVIAAENYTELTYDGSFIIHPGAAGSSCYGVGNSYQPATTHGYPWYYGYDFGAGESYVFRKYGMRHVTANFGGKNILVQGSNDWSSFTTLKSVQTVNDTNYQEWTFENSTAYRYIRFYNTDGWNPGEWYHRTADHRVFIFGDALNDTITRDFEVGNEEDLSGYNQIKYWIKSTRTGTYLQFGMGENAWDDNTTSVTVNLADTWEEKTWDISGISDANKNAIRYLGFKVTNIDSEFTMKFDDIKAVNLPPTAPTSLLTEGQTNPSQVTDTTPEFSAIYNDPDADDIADKYRIQVDDDSGFGSPIWDSGESGTAMSDCNEGERCQNISYGGSALTGDTTYYWRIKYWDDDGDEGAWSTESAYFTTSAAPTPPTSLLTEEQTNPTEVTETTPEFSAIYNDDTGDITDYYQIQVSNDPAFGSTLWDSGKTSLSPICTAGNRCTDISYGGASTDLQWGQTYYWQIKYWDQFSLEGDWSTESAYFTMSPIYEPTACLIDDSGQPGELIVKWADNTSLETGYRVERSVDAEAWTLLSTEVANTVSKTDNTVSSDHTYLYRVRANSDNGNSQWCSTSQVDYSKGNLQMQGILVR